MKKSLNGELSTLPTLDRAGLIERWQELYGNVPPINISRKLLIKALAYRLQEQAFGGLKPATKRYLKKQHTDPKIEPPVSSAKPGTKLLREWHGVIHEVIVQNTNVLYNGKSYRSLTEVAGLITGTHWSGPKFFGLNKKGKVHESK